LASLLRSLLALLFLGAAVELRADLPQRRWIVACDRDYAPYEWADAQGRPMGYTIDLIREVARIQGLDLEIRPMVWKEAREAFDRGEVDIMSGISYSNQRNARIDHSIPHATLTFSIIVRQGDGRIRSERDLKDKVILTEAADIMHEYLASQGLNVQGATSPPEALKRLAAGQGDCAVVPALTWRRYAPVPLAQRLYVLPSEHFPTKYSFGVQKGNTGLLAELNEGLFKLIANGTMARLQDRYFGSVQAEEVPLWRVLRRKAGLLVPVLLGAGLLGTLLWSFALRRLVKNRSAGLQEEIGRRKQVESDQAHLLEEIQERNVRLDALVEELRQAMKKAHELSGLLPICAGCKQIRDDKGYWQAVDQYLEAHSTASFTPEPCAECAARKDAGGSDD